MIEKNNTQTDIVVENFNWSYAQGGEDIRIQAHHSAMEARMLRREAEERHIAQQNPACDAALERLKLRYFCRDGD